MSSTSDDNPKDEAESLSVKDSSLAYPATSLHRSTQTRSSSKDDEKLQRFEAAQKKFEQLLPELLKEHKGKYAAVIGDFVEIHEDEEALIKIVLEKYGYRSMYMGEITTEKRVVRMRSPRMKQIRCQS